MPSIDELRSMVREEIDRTADWHRDDRRTIELITDDRTATTWAVHGLFKVRVDDEWIGWWQRFAFVADRSKFTGADDLHARVDQAIDVTRLTQLLTDPATAIPAPVVNPDGQIMDCGTVASQSATEALRSLGAQLVALPAPTD
jgi:hypothetical protein